MQSRKLVVIKTAGKAIKELNGIVGPVKTPVSMSTPRIRNMIVKEKLSVYECNPANPMRDQTKLTKDNYNKEIYAKKENSTESTGAQVVKKNASKTNMGSSSNTPNSTVRVTHSDF